MKNVLVTGAGGSIGSEIVQQTLNDTTVRNLYINDISESALFQIFVKCNQGDHSVNVIPIVGDISSASVRKSIETTADLNLIYNTAAYKHVYLSTINPQIYLNNNLEATKSCVSLARQHGAQLIHISTDKAVHPINPMGASKRVCEHFVLSANNEYGQKYKIVRFGNVLNSSGSVVPIFNEQIANGGPITVTDPDAKRYFMTIEQAVSLVLKSPETNDNETVLILDMGQPILVDHLARNMIVQAGLKPTLNPAQNENEIQIKYIGLREGEKLEEELTSGDLKPTNLPNIFSAQEDNDDLDQILEKFDMNLH